MLPVALRSVPLLDDREERAVLCVDVHDSLPRQVTRSTTHHSLFTTHYSPRTTHHAPPTRVSIRH